jgi:sugar lactone lactonase YvrE
MKFVLAGAAAVVALAVAAVAVTAAPSSGITVVARNLDNPRELALGRNGAVYVAEAGRAGPACSGKGDLRFCVGATASITKIAGGRQVRIANRLLSAGSDPSGTFAVGANGVAVGPRGDVYTVFTGLPPAASKGVFAAQAGRVLRVTPAGARVAVANPLAYEYARNPDRRQKDSNPYAIAYGPTGLVVADAGGNDLLQIHAGGRISTLAVFPPQRFHGRLVDSVPTSIAVGPDGAYYVGELGGGGTPDGKARVWRVVPGQKPTVYATGFTNIVGVAFGPDGSLYVSEIQRHARQRSLSGALFRVTPSGRRVELAPGRLQAPGGVVVDRRTGDVYVANFSVLPHRGQVLRIRSAPGFTG